MSLELAFAKKHPNYAPYMIVTTFESKDELKKGAHENKKILECLGVKVYHQIDATELFIETFDSQGILYGKSPTHIYFSHPHTSNSADTSILIKQFLSAACQVQNIGDKVHIFRLRGGRRTIFPSDQELNKHYQKLYGLYNGITLHGYELHKKHRFNVKRYPGYQHSKTIGNTPAPNVTGDNSVEYVLKKGSDKSKRYFSMGISSDCDSDSDNSCYGSDFNEENGYIDEHYDNVSSKPEKHSPLEISVDCDSDSDSSYHNSDDLVGESSETNESSIEQSSLSSMCCSINWSSFGCCVS